MNKKEIWNSFAIKAYDFKEYNVICCICGKKFEKDEKYLCFVINEIDYDYDPIECVYDITENLCKKCFFGEDNEM